MGTVRSSFHPVSTERVVAVPALGLSKPPAEQDLSTRIYARASPSLYGLTTELARRDIQLVLLVNKSAAHLE
jgi:hypothetical protein